MARPSFASADSYLGTPLVDLDLRAVPAGAYVVPGGSLASMIVGGGLVLVIDYLLAANLRAATSPYLFEATIDGTSVTLQYNTASCYWIFTVNGVTAVQVSPNDAGAGSYSNRSVEPRTGQLLRVIVGHSSRMGVATLGFEANGIAFTFTSAAVTTAFAAISALTLGSKIAGTSPMAAMQLQRLRAYHPSALTTQPQVSRVFLGDSISSTLQLTAPAYATSTAIYNAAEAAAAPVPFAFNLAVPGNMISDQSTIWSAYVAGGAGGAVRVVYDQSGVNDAGAGLKTTAQIVTAKIALAAAITAACPRAYKIAGYCTPCKATMDTYSGSSWTNLLGYDTALGSGTVTGWDAIVSSYYALLDDGSFGGTPGNMRALYNIDGVHPTSAGKDIMAAPISAALTAAGLR